jgi:hypothetical protein
MHTDRLTQPHPPGPDPAATHVPRGAAPLLPCPLTVGKSSAENVTLLGPCGAADADALAASSALLLSTLACMTVTAAVQ